KGLARQVAVAAEGGGAEPRYGMLGALREYALERLAASGEEETVRHRHAAYYLALAERTEPEPGAPPPAGWLGRLEPEHPNLWQALRWCLDRADAEHGLRLGGALWPFWQARPGLYRDEGRAWLASLLALPGAAAPTPARAAALQGLAVLT